MSQSENALHDHKKEICRIGKSLFDRGYAHSTAGNISVRTEAGFLITPTDACLGFLEPEQIAFVDLLGQQTSGAPASKTLSLHQAIYQSDPQARCVIHTHSTHLVALTLQGVWKPLDILPPITPYYVMKVGHVPLVPYHRPGDPDVAKIVAGMIESAISAHQPLRAVMIERLGPNVWHRSLSAAMATLEELEETARLWLLSNRSVPPLGESAIDELRNQFKLQY
jgi:ribulose-5-phosphate 4-epimerase/fuculose-1-phosphate aldolase